MYQKKKMLVLKPIHFAEFKENLSFDLRQLVSFLLEQNQLFYHFN
jgi:hypothetical protein